MSMRRWPTLPVHTHRCGAHHFLADRTLPYGRIVYDYNKQNDEDLAEAAE